MTFWKIVGFEVTPTTPSSIIRSRLPFWMSSRESESIQTLCPIPASLRKRSFIFLLLRCHPPPELSNSYPTPNKSLHPASLYWCLRMSLRGMGVLEGRGAGGHFHTLPMSEEIEGGVHHVLRGYAELAQDSLSWGRRPKAIYAHACPFGAHVPLPAHRYPRLDGDASLHLGGQNGVLVPLVLGIEDLPRRHAYEPRRNALLAKQGAGFKSEGELGAGGDKDHFGVSVSGVGKYVGST